MSRRMYALIVLAATCLGGCATHYPLENPDLRGARDQVIGDPRQEAALDKATSTGNAGLLPGAGKTARYKLPAAAALAKIESIAGLGDFSGEELGTWDKTLPAGGRITGYRPINRSMITRATPTMRELRDAAEKLHCDLLLVTMRAESHVENYDNLAALYWTGVGIWLAPGDVLEHRTTIQALLVDTKTGVILGTATGDCQIRRETPMGFKDDAESQVVTQTQLKALADVQQGCATMLKQIVQGRTHLTDVP